MVFMPNKKEKIEVCKSICDQEAEKLKVNNTTWRTVPVNNDILGPLAKANAPFICQWILYIDKKDHKIKLDGLAARVFLHEYDHLQGIVFTERQ